MRPNDECVEVLASRRHLTSLGLLTSAVDPEAASFSSNGRRAAIGCGPGCGLSRKNCNVGFVLLWLTELALEAWHKKACSPPEGIDAGNGWTPEMSREPCGHDSRSL